MVQSRNAFIELIRRQIYGDQPSSEANITKGLVNRWLNFGIAAAAKQNNKENIALDGVNYINNSFYSTFKGLAISQDEFNLWKIELPQLPLGIGSTEGISTVMIKSSDGQVSYPLIMLSQNEKSFQRGYREIPNKVIGYAEGTYVYVLSSIMLNQYTASVTMVSGGDASDLTSTINIPDDYLPTIVEYVKAQLMFQRNVPQDNVADGVDSPTTQTV